MLHRIAGYVSRSAVRKLMKHYDCNYSACHIKIVGQKHVNNIWHDIVQVLIVFAKFPVICRNTSRKKLFEKFYCVQDKTTLLGRVAGFNNEAGAQGGFAENKIITTIYVISLYFCENVTNLTLEISELQNN